MKRLGAALAVALATAVAAAAHAEIPEVEAASANLWVNRPPPRAEAPAMAIVGSHGRIRPAQNRAAGVPGMTVTVEFPVGSAELDDAQRLALYKLTREWRAIPGVRLLWVRAGADEAPHETGGGALARKRAEALRRATGGKGFPWKKVWLDAAWETCTGSDDCRRTNRQGIITVIEAR
ncbi:MAG TPA: hypothetical protein VK196_19105 [Magnetospirillum sp.]|nr:hypothetical protein [Magnetospirillum sp.]